MNNKTYLTQIYKDEPRDITLSTLIDEYSTWKDLGDHHDFPVFEMKTTHRFPMDATLVPIMKRKVMAYVFQLVNLEKIKNFDSEDFSWSDLILCFEVRVTIFAYIFYSSEVNYFDARKQTEDARRDLHFLSELFQLSNNKY